MPVTFPELDQLARGLVWVPSRVLYFLAIPLHYSHPEFLHTSETTEFHLDFSTGLIAVRERPFDLHQSDAAEQALAETLQTITMPITRPGHGSGQTDSYPKR
jgi:hypothetical protein